MSKLGLSLKQEAFGMYSSDGEYIEFLHPVLLEGPVESWLCDIEHSMRSTLKELLKNCRLGLKKVGTKREKWIKEWAGQVIFQFFILHYNLMIQLIQVIISTYLPTIHSY